EAQGGQRVDRRIDGGDALLQPVEQVVRRELLPTQPIHDRARIGTPQLAIHGSPPVAPSPPTDWHESYACVKKGPRRGSAIPPAQTKTAPDRPAPFERISSFRLLAGVLRPGHARVGGRIALLGAQHHHRR